MIVLGDALTQHLREKTEQLGDDVDTGLIELANDRSSIEHRNRTNESDVTDTLLVEVHDAQLENGTQCVSHENKYNYIEKIQFSLGRIHAPPLSSILKLDLPPTVIERWSVQGLSSSRLHDSEAHDSFVSETIHDLHYRAIDYLTSLAQTNAQLLSVVDQVLESLHLLSANIRRIIPFPSNDITAGVRQTLASVLFDCIRNTITIYQIVSRISSPKIHSFLRLEADHDIWVIYELIQNGKLLSVATFPFSFLTTCRTHAGYLLSIVLNILILNDAIEWTSNSDLTCAVETCIRDAKDRLPFVDGLLYNIHRKQHDHKWLFDRVVPYSQEDPVTTKQMNQLSIYLDAASWTLWNLRQSCTVEEMMTFGPHIRESSQWNLLRTIIDNIQMLYNRLNLPDGNNEKSDCEHDIITARNPTQATEQSHDYSHDPSTGQDNNTIEESISQGDDIISIEKEVILSGVGTVPVGSSESFTIDNPKQWERSNTVNMEENLMLELRQRLKSLHKASPPTSDEDHQAVFMKKSNQFQVVSCPMFLGVSGLVLEELKEVLPPTISELDPIQSI